MIRNSRIRRIADITCVFVVLTMLVPIFSYSLMSIPFADDFSYASNTRDTAEMYGGFIQAIFARVWYEYLNFEGCVYSVFWMGLGSVPFLRGGILGLRYFILFVHLLFYVVLFWTLKQIIFRTVPVHKLSLTIEIYTILAYWLINNQLNQEVYTWALIQSAYIMPIITMFLGIGMYIKHLGEPIGSGKNRVYCILAAILGFLAGGAPLDIAVLNCGLYLVACYYGAVHLQSRKKEWMFFVFSAMGLLINLAAPGNGVRHGSEWGIGFFARTFLVACYYTIRKTAYLLARTPFLFLCVLVFLLIYREIDQNSKSKITYEHPLMLGVFLLFGVSFTSWPYTFGNGLSFSSDFDGRVDYVFDLALYSVTIIWICYFAMYVKKHSRVSFDGPEFSKRLYFGAIITLVAVSVMIVFQRDNEVITTRYMIDSIADGSGYRYSNYQESILEQIENGGDTVDIYYDQTIIPKRHAVIRGLRLTDDANDSGLFWRNCAVARYYGKQYVYMHY